MAEVVTLRFADEFRAGYRRLPKQIQRQVDRALDLIKENPRHPSLHTKKMRGSREVWEARVSYKYRMTFVWDGDLVIFRRVGPHDILKEETR